MNQGEPKQNEQESQQAPEVAGVPVEPVIAPETAAASSLEQKLADAEAKAAEMHDAFLRAKADAENTRRRAQEDIARAHKFAIESFAEAMVPVKDSLEMALKLETPSIFCRRDT
jgi:molecular chaperone GrpE